MAALRSILCMVLSFFLQLQLMANVESDTLHNSFKDCNCRKQQLRADKEYRKLKKAVEKSIKVGKEDGFPVKRRRQWFMKSRSGTVQVKTKSRLRDRIVSCYKW
jgi:hypothetical protein